MLGDYLTLIGLFLTVGVNIATVAYMSGSMNTRQQQLEKELSKIEQEFKEIRSLIPVLATIKAQVEMIGATVSDLKQLVMKQDHA